jgi:N6-L-threonylcarbamoyladenine synthase
MNILALETSCDETSAAVIKNDWILSNVVSSQVDLHKKWGGVVPDIARRAHQERKVPVIKEALKRAQKKFDDIDYFAVTYGPGLAIALEVGIKEMKKLSRMYKKPLIPVNHMEAHLLSSFAKNSKGNNLNGPSPEDLPAIGMLISGGHTEMILMKDFGKYTLLGETLDDAAGEAFDKVAKMLGLGYPGGPIISEFAKKGDPGRFELPVPMEYSGDLNFSYSGLKTACLYKIRDFTKNNPDMPQQEWVYDFCADFLESIIRSIVVKLEAAVKEHPVKSILLGGGVTSNVQLRRGIRKSMRKLDITVFQPHKDKLFTDNAAMIGLAAFHRLRYDNKAALKVSDLEKLDRDPVAGINDNPIS